VVDPSTQIVNNPRINGGKLYQNKTINTYNRCLELRASPNPLERSTKRHTFEADTSRLSPPIMIIDDERWAAKINMVEYHGDNYQMNYRGIGNVKTVTPISSPTASATRDCKVIRNNTIVTKKDEIYINTLADKSENTTMETLLALEENSNMIDVLQEPLFALQSILNHGKRSQHHNLCYSISIIKQHRAEQQVGKAKQQSELSRCANYPERDVIKWSNIIGLSLKARQNNCSGALKKSLQNYWALQSNPSLYWESQSLCGIMVGKVVMQQSTKVHKLKRLFTIVNVAIWYHAGSLNERLHTFSRVINKKK
jgi:hypothetical protein